jgi:BolA protein
MTMQGHPEHDLPAPGGTARSAAGTAISAADVTATLRARLARLMPAVLEIRDDSAAHAGHAGAAGGGGHFSLLIVSQTFVGLPRLQRHQRVLREVADLLPHPVHALSIRALTPEEFPFQP